MPTKSTPHVATIRLIFVSREAAEDYAAEALYLDGFLDSDVAPATEADIRDTHLNAIIPAGSPELSEEEDEADSAAIAAILAEQGCLACGNKGDSSTPVPGGGLDAAFDAAWEEADFDDDVDETFDFDLLIPKP